MILNDLTPKRNKRLRILFFVCLALLLIAAVLCAVLRLRSKTDMISSDTWELKETADTESTYAQYRIYRAAYTDGDLYLYYYVDFGSLQNLSAWQEQSEESSPALHCLGTDYTTQYGISPFNDVTEEGYCVFPQVDFPNAGIRLDLELTLGDVSIPFSMVPTQDLGKDYVYESADEGGVIAISWMEDEELLMDVYLFSNNGREIFSYQRHPVLESGNGWPFYLLAPDGSHIFGTPVFASNHVSRWNFGNTTPGEYFFCMEYMPFTSAINDSSEDPFIVNLEENTTNFESYTFPGGTVSITGIESLDLPAGTEFEGTVIEDVSDYWLLMFHLEPDDPDLIPYLPLDFAFYSDSYSDTVPVFGQIFHMGVQGDLDGRYVLGLPKEEYDLNVARTTLVFTRDIYYPLLWWHEFQVPFTVE